MSLLKKLFGSKKEIKILDYQSFWNWFLKNEKAYYSSVKKGQDVDSHFLSHLMPKLQQLNPQFYCLTGMINDDVAELVITPEGDIKTIVFVEDLIAAAPALPNWKFTALKPATGLSGTVINMDGFEFGEDNLSFVSTRQEEYPDEIEITLIHNNYTEEAKTTIANGSLIYLDNGLGEMDTVTLIDSIKVTGPSSEFPETIPIVKLKDYLIWREKEFIEKYKSTAYDSSNDRFAVLEARDENGHLVLATINQDILAWDGKASHPWMMIIEIKFDGSANNGMPDDTTYQLMNEFEDQLSEKLKDADGYLNLGREIHSGIRTIYFACKEFRQASRTTSLLIHQYLESLDISYDIVKDKYWMSMNRFRQSSL